MNLSIRKGPTCTYTYPFDGQVIDCGSAAALFSMTWKTPSLFLFPLAVVPSAIYCFSPTKRKSVLVTDILSLSFAHSAQSLLKIDTFKTGTILLSCLFFYDIWWVFGTEVVSVVSLVNCEYICNNIQYRWSKWRHHLTFPSSCFGRNP
jgi:hypothetical protein